MMKKSLGVFQLGRENVELCVRDDTGGEFYFMPTDKGPGRIVVGLGYFHWEDVLMVLLHETFEYLATRNGLRLKPCGKMGGDEAHYTFHMDHCAFGQICCGQAVFMSAVLPLLADEYKKWRKRKK